MQQPAAPTPSLLARYLRELGIPADGSALRDGPSMELLTRVYRAHLRRFAWSNIRLLQGAPFPVRQTERDLDTLYEEGGVCYENCGLMVSALRELGFEAYRGAGEVFMPPKGALSGDHTHAVVLVKLGGATYVADVGFASAPSTVLKLEEGTVQELPCGRKIAMTHWKDEQEGAPLRWVMNAVTPDGTFAPIIRFEDRPVLDCEAEAAREWLMEPATSPLLMGCLVKIERDDYSALTLATGLWAGSGTPAGMAKFVRKPAPISGGQEEVSHLPADGEEVARLLREEFGLQHATALPLPASSPAPVAATEHQQPEDEQDTVTLQEPASPFMVAQAGVDRVASKRLDSTEASPLCVAVSGTTTQPSASVAEELTGAFVQLTTRTSAAAAE